MQAHQYATNRPLRPLLGEGSPDTRRKGSRKTTCRSCRASGSRCKAPPKNRCERRRTDQAWLRGSSGPLTFHVPCHEPRHQHTHCPFFMARRENADVKFCSDTGGNAEKFCGFDAEEALLELKSLWSKAWKEQGDGPAMGHWDDLWLGVRVCQRYPCHGTFELRLFSPSRFQQLKIRRNFLTRSSLPNAKRVEQN